MQEMRHKRRILKKEAVSPVVGEILLVAMVIAIAATIYCYVRMTVSTAEQPPWLTQLFGRHVEGDSQDGPGSLGMPDDGQDKKGSGDEGKGDVADDPPKVTNVQILRTNLPHTGYVKDGDSLTITADIDDEELETVLVCADFSELLEAGGTQVTPDLFEEGVATWVLLNTDFCGLDGLKSITVTTQDKFSSEGNAQASLIVDNTKPSSLASFKAAPGHNKITLTWTNPVGDPNLDTYGILIRRTAWNGYPTYSGSEPTYPTSSTGDVIYQHEGMIVSYSDTFDAQGRDRDIYYYSAFIYDKAYNYASADKGSRGRATNYWLGDVEPRNDVLGTIGDGYVNKADIDAFDLTYYEDPSSPNWNPHCDVGPTHDSTAKGIPLPDKKIEFDDMMIFSLNYGVVKP